MAIKYYLFCSWQVNYLKTKLAAKSLKQIRDTNKSSHYARFLEFRETVLNVSTERLNNG